MAKWAAFTARFLADTLPADDPWRRLELDPSGCHIAGLPNGVVLDGLDLAPKALEKCLDIATLNAEDLDPRAVRLLAMAFSDSPVPDVALWLDEDLIGMPPDLRPVCFDAWMRVVSPALLTLIGRRAEYGSPHALNDLVTVPSRMAAAFLNGGSPYSVTELAGGLALRPDAYARRLAKVRGES